MVYHLFEVVFISVGGSDLCASPITIPLWVPGGWKESAGTYSCLFVVLMYVFTLSLCVCW